MKQHRFNATLPSEISEGIERRMREIQEQTGLAPRRPEVIRALLREALAFHHLLEAPESVRSRVEEADSWTPEDAWGHFQKTGRFPWGWGYNSAGNGAQRDWG